MDVVISSSLPLFYVQCILNKLCAKWHIPVYIRDKITFSEIHICCELAHLSSLLKFSYTDVFKFPIFLSQHLGKEVNLVGDVHEL